jgi:SAM-dependent methyltransferase
MRRCSEGDSAVKPVFDAYSSYYDLLYQDKDYAAEAAYVLSAIRAHKPDAEQVLELGCGTGAHAIALAKQGIFVTGIDQSQSMLARARRRLDGESPAIRSRVQIAQGDLRSIRTGKRYDAVISLFHVISYQTSDRDLAMAFETAAQHLLPGGVFAFDFWFGPAVLAQQPEVRVRRLSDAGSSVTRIAEPELRSREHIVDVNYSLFIEEKASGVISRLHETHSMRYLFLPELRVLAGNWFEPLETRAWLSGDRPDATTWSAFMTMGRR